MAIVPSGTRRLIKLQQVNPAAQPQARDTVQQEDISLDAQPEQQEEYNPLGKLDNTLQNQQPAAASNVPNKEQLDQAVEPNPGVVAKEGEGEVVDGGSIKIKQALDKMLIEMGVPQRKLIQHDKRRFQYNKKQQSGYFEVPERTGSGQQIGEDNVDKICQTLEKSFNIDTEPVFQGGIWKVTFKPRVIEQQEMASSWDAHDGASDKGQAKAALSKNSFIKQSHNSIVDSLIKQGFGGSHGS